MSSFCHESWHWLAGISKFLLLQLLYLKIWITREHLIVLPINLSMCHSRGSVFCWVAYLEQLMAPPYLCKWIWWLVQLVFKVDLCDLNSIQYRTEFAWFWNSENAGLLGLTRVGSRRVVQISAGFMIFFSILGKPHAFYVIMFWHLVP